MKYTFMELDTVFFCYNIHYITIVLRSVELLIRVIQLANVFCKMNSMLCLNLVVRTINLRNPL